MEKYKPYTELDRQQVIEKLRKLYETYQDLVNISLKGHINHEKVLEELIQEVGKLLDFESRP